MPAYEEEIDAAIEEGIELKTLISPVGVKTAGGKVTAVEFIENDLGEVDSSGRRRPVPRKGSEHEIEVDTLVVAIGEQTLPFELQGSDGLEFAKGGSLLVKADTLETSRKGVFGGGDVVTGPNTVIDAVAAGKKAAVMIDRYVRGEELNQLARPALPTVHVPAMESAGASELAPRARQPVLTVDDRVQGFVECDLALTEEQAKTEALRCLRCDLEFTKPKTVETKDAVVQAAAEE
jgi:NADH-quinone oxidoreductase subunit F